MWVALTLGSNVVVMLSAPCFCLTTSHVSNSSHNISAVIFDTPTRDDRQQYNKKTSSQAPSYASLKLSPTYLLTDGGEVKSNYRGKKKIEVKILMMMICEQYMSGMQHM